MRDPILVESRVVMSLMRLGSGNGVQLMSYFFGVAEGIISMIVREFCHMVRLHFRKLFVQFPIELQFRVLSKEFEGLHEISHVINVIDGSHIPHSSTYHRRRKLLLLKAISFSTIARNC
jgi:hypothetical protein